MSVVIGQPVRLLVEERRQLFLQQTHALDERRGIRDSGRMTLV